MFTCRNNRFVKISNRSACLASVVPEARGFLVLRFSPLFSAGHTSLPQNVMYGIRPAPYTVRLLNVNVSTYQHNQDIIGKTDVFK